MVRRATSEFTVRICDLHPLGSRWTICFLPNGDCSERRGAGNPPMPFVMFCPYCRQRLKVPNKLTGQHFDCPACHFSLLAEQPKRPPAAPTSRITSEAVPLMPALNNDLPKDAISHPEMT